MGTKLPFWIGICFLVLSFSETLGKHHHNSKTPHLCDAEGESSEECMYRNSLQAPGLDVFPRNENEERYFASPVKVRFYLHNNINNPRVYMEIFPNDPEGIRKAHPFPQSPNTQWKILIPSFPMNGKSPFPDNVIDAYMTRMHNFPQEKYNIIVVDWDQGACISDINFPNSTYTEQVGIKVAELLLFLNEQNFATLRTDVHLIGFSLGAHVAGETARTIFRKYAKKNLIYRLTALDPAGKKFWKGRNSIFDKDDLSPFRRAPAIRRSFVAFLDAYHTSLEFGLRRHLGDVDFYPYDGRLQAGCDNYKGIIGKLKTKLKDYAQLCSHMYATELFAKSINDKTMLGCTGCDYWDLYERRKCKCEDEIVLGEFVTEKKYEGYPLASGEAFIKPDDLSNFAKRFKDNLESRGEPINGRDRWHQLCN